MKQTIQKRLSALRKKMVQESIDLYIIPSSDPHLSEYVATRFKSRAFITGFTGSAGTAVVTQTKAVLFTDGRYFIQAERELEGTGFSLIKMGIPTEPTLNEWIDAHIDDENTIGYDGRLFAYNQIQSIEDALAYRIINFDGTHDLINSIWLDRPSLPDGKAFWHEHKFTGAYVSDKLERIRNAMKTNKCNTYLLNSLNDIAWLFNIRGTDIESTPVVYAYATITDMSSTLYIDPCKLNQDFMSHLHNEGVQVKHYNLYYDDLKTIESKTIFIDPNKVNALMIEALPDSNRIIEGHDLTYMEKACFTDHEITNMKTAHIKDGVAMVNFLSWFDENVTKGFTEIDVKEKITECRLAMEGFIEPSFESIPAYAGNAAMMHYSADATNPVNVEPKGLFLLDSGGQYYDGTTDITRTIPCGPLTDEEIRDFTLVLKSHIALSKAIFLYGVTGTNLDILARQPIWAEHMDYKCGTGHSVGYLLSVHDGPARIRMQYNDIILKPGMVLTNEPGIYKEDKHGIRIENIIIVKEKVKNEMGTFLDFETISFCPIDQRAIDITLLSQEEVEWLNHYHKEVFEKLSPHLKENELMWLAKATSPMS